MQTNLSTFFWPNPLKVWVEVSACQGHGKEGTEGCCDGKWVTASPKDLRPGCCTAPMLDQCFRQGCWPGWSDTLAGRGWTAWCSEPVQGWRRSRKLSLGVGRRTARLVQLWPCSLLSFGNLCSECLRTCIPHSLAKAHSGKGQTGTSRASGMTFGRADEILYPLETAASCSWARLLPPFFSSRLNKPLKTWALAGSKFRSKFCHLLSPFVNKMDVTTGSSGGFMEWDGNYVSQCEARRHAMVFSFPKHIESRNCPMDGTCLKSRGVLCMKR